MYDPRLARHRERAIAHNPFDFGARLRFDAATVTKIKISPATPKREIISTTASVKMNDALLCCPFCRAEGHGDLGSDPFDLQ